MHEHKRQVSRREFTVFWALPVRIMRRSSTKKMLFAIWSIHNWIYVCFFHSFSIYALTFLSACYSVLYNFARKCCLCRSLFCLFVLFRCFVFCFVVMFVCFAYSFYLLVLLVVLLTCFVWLFVCLFCQLFCLLVLFGCYTCFVCWVFACLFCSVVLHICFVSCFTCLFGLVVLPVCFVTCSCSFACLFFNIVYIQYNVRPKYALTLFIANFTA